VRRSPLGALIAKDIREHRLTLLGLLVCVSAIYLMGSRRTRVG